MSQLYDVVIVGARCAGSPLATLLAQRGMKVCAIDRARFPSETPSTHVLQPCGVQILEQLGALDSLWRAGAAPVKNFTLINDGTRLSLDNVETEFAAPGLSARRATLDNCLVAAAEQAGATVMAGVKVHELLQEGGRIAGVVTDNGPIQAQLVVGADGRHSTLANLVGAREYRLAPAQRIFAWGYFEGVTDHDSRLEVALLGELAFLACPTDAGLYTAAVTIGLDRAERFLADRDQEYAAALQTHPELAARLAHARLDGPLRVVTKWHGYFREATGPGWALLGDAGHFKDPTVGLGISDSLRHAVALAEAIGGSDGSAASLDDRLARWWRWRDRDAKATHWFATDMGAAGAAPPLVSQILRDLGDEPDGATELTKVFNHDALPSEVISARRIARAATRVVRHRPREIPALAGEVARAVAAQVHRNRPAVDRPPRATRLRS